MWICHHPADQPFTGLELPPHTVPHREVLAVPEENGQRRELVHIVDRPPA
jgi:hypothetical protein